MFEGVPWMIGGNQAVHSADVGRQLAYAATGGETGINFPTDLKVTELDTPGAAVSIAPGGGPIVNTYPGVEGQSYICRNPEDHILDIPATDSTSGATRYVIVRLDDPQYNGGQVPADPAKGPYIYPELVSSLSGHNFPFMALARIDQPDSTATIRNSMIVDLRRIANAREKTFRASNPSAATDAGLTLTASGDDGEWFPNDGGNYEVSIPSWATRVQITAYWTGVKYLANTNPFGQFWVEYGPYLRASTRELSTGRFDFDAALAATNMRTNWIMGDEVAVPPEYRGTTQLFVMKARYWTDSDGATLDQHSGIIFDVRFLESADAGSLS